MGQTKREHRVEDPGDDILATLFLFPYDLRLYTASCAFSNLGFCVHILLQPWKNIKETQIRFMARRSGVN
jgi:hypothetical protein